MGDERQYESKPQQQSAMLHATREREGQQPSRSDDDIAHSKQIVHQYAPELVPFIRQLYEMKMIDGWRAVTAHQLPPSQNPDET